MVTYVLVAGLVLALVLLVALHYRLSDLPFAVWSEARRERQDNAAQALGLMTEAVAKKAGTAILSIQQHEAGIAASYRAQVADARNRARMSEIRAGDTVTALTAATALVRELRQALDDLPRGAAPATPVDPSERVTLEVRPDAVETASKPGAPEPESREHPSPRHGLPSVAPKDGDERPSEDELTRVAERPPSGVLKRTLLSPGSTGGKP